MDTIFLDYIRWHFSVAPPEILNIMRNYMKASWHRFLIAKHLQTLFSPWHRQNPSDFGKRERTFGDKMLDALADIYIRLIAASIRSIIIVSGLIWQLVLFIAFMLLLIVWIAWPAVSVFSIIYGIELLL